MVREIDVHIPQELCVNFLKPNVLLREGPIRIPLAKNDTTNEIKFEDS